MVAAAFPDPRESRPLPLMTARWSCSSRSTKFAFPVNSLVTGPTLTFSLPRKSSPSQPSICAPGMSGTTCSRSVSTSHACSTGALTVNSLAIFIGVSLSSGGQALGVFDECRVHGGAVVGCLRQCAERGERLRCGEIGDVERGQRGDPVDGLGDAGRLVEVEIARAADESG